ncbi:hypothetical protein MMAG44476_26414 [Mycolicibacterium mageritense DSM 44476 = CIP 104973]|uniref:DUF5642 domain-containing protein n=1 Tax=Mycolicibacterium mageritense TaxID=53462 RepID=A0AAI8TQB8_MYCME|nr:DUF5642 family protein [Mycolicibacterium mageritense]MCC9181916.1 DUF5642 family protein [Mycolicibacterium mageritense]TXI63550.1 MAG: hypothetical protein E6Q55_08710 [Mycolicibacterium mageritense]CDO25224.1 hypothetical protein BN978_05727 [Mycolicibacterium mageritense DSM 44476 = CIP 104973]BBX31477.1 hypothetical protein MMAGJ_07590 [Mycolicibacterium mageritense]BDY26597.1 hypothetical protein hbim_00511 [Mycolicibacterium mageritense]
MLNRKLALAVLSTGACVTALVGCSQSDATEFANANIANVTKLKSSFGPEFKVSEVAPTGIDPKMLAPQKMPPGMKFEPADCAKFAEGQSLPAGLKGNMAATAAEGAGNRFIVLAVETSEPIPMNDPGDACKQVKFAGPGSRGQVDVVEAPQIDGARTVGTHRVVQAAVQGRARTGELYNYVASFGPFMVIVTANPLVVPNKPLAPVDTQRARDLLTAAVAAVRG